ncbi:MAG: hypothetical protein WDA06_00920 [Phenylobacterium sp.]
MKDLIANLREEWMVAVCPKCKKHNWAYIGSSNDIDGGYDFGAIECYNCDTYFWLSKTDVEYYGLTKTSIEDASTRGERFPILFDVLDKIPVLQILKACSLIEKADDNAMACDGNVPPAAAMLSAAELQKCLSAIWACKESFERIAELISPAKDE